MLVDQAQLEAIIENCPAIICVKDLDGRYLLVNREFERLFSVRREDVRGRTDFDLFPSELAATFREHDRAVAAGGGPIEFEEVAPLPDGLHTYITVKFLLRGAARAPYATCSISTDITGRKQIQDALFQSEERMRLVVETALDAVVTMNDRGIVTGWNAQAERMFGWPAAEILGQPLAATILPERFRGDHQRGLDRFLRTGEGPILGRRLEIAALRRDGRELPVELTVSAARAGAGWTFSAFLRDIEERRRMEADLRASEQRFRGLIEHSSEGIVLFDARGAVVYASPSVTRILGYSAAEVAAMTALSIVHEEDHAHAAAQLALAASQPGVPTPLRGRVRHSDGSWRQLEGVLTSLLHEPAIGAIVNNFRDVTDRMQLEARLLQAQKVEAVGRLAGGVAHDFNNLLTAIMGHTSLARMALPPDDPAQQELTAVAAAAHRSAALTSQLLAFARRQLIQPVPTDLNELVGRIEGMLSRLIGEQIALVSRLAPHPCTAIVDPGQIEQVIVNLAVNARDAMPDGGELVIATALLDLTGDPAGDSRELPPGCYVQLTMSDSGTGMTPEVRAHLFEPFFTTKPKGAGTGLGLATSYGIIRQHQGFVSIDSEPGRGTTVTIHLPASAGAGTPIEAPYAALESLAGGTETILLAEDEPAVRAVARATLRRCGYEVLEAARGEEALQIASRNPTIHLLVTDVVMPEMSGIELAERLRRERPTLRVLYVSGYTEHMMPAGDRGDASASFMAKPFRPADLAARVRRVLDES